MKTTGSATQAKAATAARQVRVVMIGMLATLLAVVCATAWAQAGASASTQGGPGMHGAMHHGGMQHAGMHQRAMHHGGGMHGGMGGMGGMMFGGSPERMGRMIDRLLDGLNATDAQRAQIKQIAAAAATDLRAQAQAGRAIRERGMLAFTSPSVDAAAAERARQEMLQHQDQMSRRASQAMLEAARVLTPDQRARIGERIRDRQARHADRMKRMEREPRR
ncbi:MAG TPA: Spy/CpxP family protein refolding chaperone [Caldimonas sp.]|nr:Spy/CpxP family protein refolding chaperone [Caldimonas sp.]HEX2542089.1 Spy/CpxP family protein refolding chaperone [Caldimonas sp.]